MKTATVTLTFIIALLFGGSIYAHDLELKLRTHPDEIILGDPLYLELTITNRSNEVITAPLPNVLFGSFELWARGYLDKSLAMKCTGDTAGANHVAGDSAPGKYLPGTSVRYYAYTFLPDARRINHPFWKTSNTKEGVDVWGVFRIERNVLIETERTPIRIGPRKKSQTEAINFWTNEHNESEMKKLFGPTETAILPKDLQLPFHVFSRKWTQELASKVTTGGLAELLQLTLRLQEMEYSAGTREKDTKALIEFISKQPDIKRQALAHQLRLAGEGLFSADTETALREMADK